MSNEVRAIFNRIAPVYDQLNDQLSWGQHRLWKEMTVKWSAAKPGDTGLDLCCGSGDLSFRLARHVGVTGQVYGVDFSANLLNAAQERCKNYYPLSPINWVEADVLNLPFDDNYFDALTVGFGVRNYENLDKGLSEMLRVVRPGGKLVILEFSKPKRFPVKQYYAFHSKYIIPFFGKRISKDEKAYAYLPESVAAFPEGKDFENILIRLGYKEVKAKLVAGGIATIYSGLK